MTSVFGIYDPQRRRNPFDPAIDPSLLAGDQPDAMQGAPARGSVFAPAPGENAPAPPAASRNAFAPAPTAAGGRRANIAGDPLPQRPEPPVLEDLPTAGAFTLTGPFRTQVAAVQARNQMKMQTYQAQLADYRNEINQQQQMGYYRNMPRMSVPYQVVGPDGQAHMQTHNMVTGEVQDLGPAPASSKNVSPVDVAEARKRRPSEDILNDPDSTPQEKASAREALGLLHPHNEPREPRPTSTPLTIQTTDGPVQGSYDPATRRYLDGAGTPIPPEKLKGAQKIGGAGVTLRDRNAEARSHHLENVQKQNPDVSEEDLQTEGEKWDRLNRPSIAAGRAKVAAGITAGQSSTMEQNTSVLNPRNAVTKTPSTEVVAPSGIAGSPVLAETPESIRADYKAGKITRAAAKQKLAGHGFK